MPQGRARTNGPCEPLTVKPNDNAERRASIATGALVVAQLVSWGSIYYAFSLLVVPMESAMGWSRAETTRRSR